MQTKSFVSILFSRQKLQVAKLNSQKSRVEKFATVDLPQGLISDYKVVNPRGLAQVIKNIWKELRLGEKTVGLVVPEFSTFIKPLTLPKIEIRELDEAVRWQAQEFLPSGTSEMVMDWKIVGETPDKYHILTLAMKKEILAGYVDAVSMAGLFPLLIKTPAIILTNISGSEAGGKLIVFSNLGETILVVADGRKILGSSVVGPEDKVDVSEIARQIINHYKEIDVKKVFVGGGESIQAIGGALQKALGKPVEILRTGVHGLPPEQAEKYLIPIALGQAKSVGPSDETTINLLPFSWVKRYENKRLKSQIWGLLTLLTLGMLACLIISTGTYFYLGGQAQLIAKENEAKKRGLPSELTDKITEINEASSKVLLIEEIFFTPQEVVNEIVKVRPADVSILQYRLDLDSGKIDFGGIAGTRESLIKFKEGLGANKYFGFVVVPLSSFEKEVDLEYEVSFTFLPATKKLTKKVTPTPTK